jgi:hypothetical protein
VRKRIDHGAFVVALVCPEEPAVNERIDLATVKFDRKTAITSPTTRPATTHSYCCARLGAFGLDGHTVGRFPIIPMFSVTIDCSAIVPDCIGRRTLYGNGNIG